MLIFITVAGNEEANCFKKLSEKNKKVLDKRNELVYTNKASFARNEALRTLIIKDRIIHRP